MKLFAILILKKGTDSNLGDNVLILKKGTELSNFSFFERKSVDEFIAFTSKILVERTTPDVGRQSVKEGNYMVHACVRSNGIGAVCISDHVYPHRVAHSMLDKVLDEFGGAVPPQNYSSPENLKDNGVTGFDGVLERYLSKYQDPKSVDPVSKMQADLEDTKIILHDAIGSVLSRGEKLDDLVEKSEGLSMQSKAFYKTAKKTNSCCGSWT